VLAEPLGYQLNSGALKDKNTHTTQEMQEIFYRGYQASNESNHKVPSGFWFHAQWLMQLKEGRLY